MKKGLFILKDVLICLLLVVLGMPTVSFAGESQDSHASAYVIGPEDTVRVTVDQHPEWSGEFLINPKGEILLVDIGEFDIAGLTRMQAEEKLASALLKYIKTPKVTIEMVKYGSLTINVLGEVNFPGRYSTGGKTMTLRDAVIMAGLPTRLAATGRVFIVSPSKQRTHREIVNLDRVLYRGELSRNVELNPGDVVFIPRSILGEISNFISIFLSPITTVFYAKPVLP